MQIMLEIANKGFFKSVEQQPELKILDSRKKQELRELLVPIMDRVVLLLI